MRKPAGGWNMPSSAAGPACGDWYCAIRRCSLSDHPRALRALIGVAMRIGIPVHDGVDLLDVAGPIEMFTWVPESAGIEPVVISQNGGPLTSLSGLTFNAQISFADA